MLKTIKRVYMMMKNYYWISFHRTTTIIQMLIILSLIILSIQMSVIMLTLLTHLIALHSTKEFYRKVSTHLLLNTGIY
jgi:hypothetical protein